MKKTSIITLCSLWFALNGCNQTNKQQTTATAYHAKVYQTENNQYGYDIYKDSAIVIHQPIIPGVAGNEGFSTEEAAQKVADLMIYKLDKGIMPPSVSIEQLDSLGVLKH